mgnify:CR=1 FL=1
MYYSFTETVIIKRIYILDNIIDRYNNKKHKGINNNTSKEMLVLVLVSLCPQDEGQRKLTPSGMFTSSECPQEEQVASCFMVIPGSLSLIKFLNANESLAGIILTKLEIL